MFNPQLYLYGDGPTNSFAIHQSRRQVPPGEWGGVGEIRAAYSKLEGARRRVHTASERAAFRTRQHRWMHCNRFVAKIAIELKTSALESVTDEQQEVGAGSLISVRGPSRRDSSSFLRSAESRRSGSAVKA